MENRSDLTCRNDALLFDNVTVHQLELTVRELQRSYKPFYLCLQLLICVFGVFSNVAHILVLNRPTMRCLSVNHILRSVAFADFGTMFSNLLVLIWFKLIARTSHDPCSPGSSMLEAALLLVHVFLSIFLHSLSLWLIVAMALTRDMTLRSPRPGSKWLRPQRASDITRYMTFGVLLLCVPTAFLHKINEVVPPPSCNTTIPPSTYKLTTTEFIKSEGCLPLKIHLWIFGLTCKVLPCLFLLMLSSSLIYAVHKQGRRREGKFSVTSATARSNRRVSLVRDRRTTISLIIVIVVFLFTELPQGILTILSAIYTTDIYFHVYIWVGDFLDLLSLINSSVNFIIYCLASSAYREAFCMLFCHANAATSSLFQTMWRSDSRPDDVRRNSSINNNQLKVFLSSKRGLEKRYSDCGTSTSNALMPPEPPVRRVSFACDGDECM